MPRVFNPVTVMAACAALVAAPGVVAPGVASAGRRTPAARAVHVGVRVSRGPWSATLKPAGMLPDGPRARRDGLVNDAELPGGGPVIGGDTLAMIGFPSPQKRTTPVLLLYTRTAGGWSAARAPGTYAFPQSPSSSGSFGIAVGGGVVAVREYGLPESVSPSCDSPVFVAGPSGFSGNLTPAACLDLSFGGAPVAAGIGAIVAASGASSLSVFAEPAAGWSGTVTRAAQLQAGDGESLTSASMSGTTIAAVGQATNTVYIFTEPAGGWSGVIHETARLRVPGGVRAATLSGKTLVALGVGGVIDSDENIARDPVFVLRRPAAGWQALRSPKPRAFVETGPGQDSTDYGLARASLAGATTAFTDITTCDGGYAPCPSTVWAINGLSSTVAASPLLPVNPSSDTIAADGTPLASDGTTLALGADGVRLYSIARTAPARVTRATLTGLTATNLLPALGLSAVAGKGAPALASLRVLVPRGLGGSGHPRTIALKPSTRVAAATLRRLHPSAAFRRSVRRLVAHGARITVVVPVELIDTAGHSSESEVKLTVTR